MGKNDTGGGEGITFWVGGNGGKGWSSGGGDGRGRRSRGGGEGGRSSPKLNKAFIISHQLQLGPHLYIWGKFQARGN